MNQVQNLKFCHLLLRNLILDEEYAKQVLPYLKLEYFDYDYQKKIIGFIAGYWLDHRCSPSPHELEASSVLSKLKDSESKLVAELIAETKTGEIAKSREWLLQETEKYCQEKSIYNAIVKSISIYDGSDQKHDKHAIPTLLTEALSVSFTNRIGQDYFRDAEERYERYTVINQKIPYKLSLLNRAFDGGLIKKSLTVVQAGTNVGKSAFCCDESAWWITAGYNVGYISLEMDEDMVAERIDANLMQYPISDVKKLSKDVYKRQIDKFRSMYKGNLKIKQFPPATAHVGHFRYLLDEWKLKEKFIPDVLIVDYINLCASTRFKMGSNAKSYEYIKAISEEMRGLAVERNLAIVTPTQTNRSGFNNLDAGLDDVSESFGLPMTADAQFSLSVDENLEKMGQAQIKILKSRYSNKKLCSKFCVGYDTDKMTFYDLSSGAVPVDNSSYYAAKDENEGNKKKIDTSGWNID